MQAASAPLCRSSIHTETSIMLCDGRNLLLFLALISPLNRRLLCLARFTEYETLRESENHAVSVLRTIVIVVAVVVFITEIRCAVSAAQPPIDSRCIYRLQPAFILKEVAIALAVALQNAIQ